MTKAKNILLIVGGGIAAYKAGDLIRALQKKQAQVKCILTKAGSQFITPLTLSSLSKHKTYEDLFQTQTHIMDHIHLTRDCDMILVAPATANLIAKMAHGIGDDLASTCLLAANKPIYLAPAMNHKMATNKAFIRNVQTLRQDGINILPFDIGELACGETGLGRMMNIEDIADLLLGEKPLSGKKAFVTAGPTYEKLDPVRALTITNHASGKTGYEIAGALAKAGAHTILISGPTHLELPYGVKHQQAISAQDMLEACLSCLPCDIGINAAAIGDFTPSRRSNKKIKKHTKTITLTLKQNADILKTLGRHANRPSLLVGFCLETDNLLQTARQKRIDKHCDWICANQLTEKNPIFGLDDNHIYLIDKHHVSDWGQDTKHNIAKRLTQKIISHFANKKTNIKEDMVREKEVKEKTSKGQSAKSQAEKE